MPSATGGFRTRSVVVPEGGWVKGRGDSPPVLYRWPALLGNPDLPVWVTEGERDADTLAERGMLSTTVALSGRRVR